jgi:multiple sugar transport system permease protein
MAVRSIAPAALAATPARRLLHSRGFLGLVFMLPAAVLLLLFLAYPLGLGIWLGFTDVKVGRPGGYVGLENYEWLWRDRVFWLSVFNTFLYTAVASIFKLAIGLWLALLLNRHLPFKAILRAVVLLVFLVRKLLL